MLDNSGRSHEFAGTNPQDLPQHERDFFNKPFSPGFKAMRQVGYRRNKTLCDQRALPGNFESALKLAAVVDKDIEIIADTADVLRKFHVSSDEMIRWCHPDPKLLEPPK